MTEITLLYALYSLSVRLVRETPNPLATAECMTPSSAIVMSYIGQKSSVLLGFQMTLLDILTVAARRKDSSKLGNLAKLFREGLSRAITKRIIVHMRM